MMRKNLIGFGLFFAFAAVVILPFFNATAKNPNIVERFSIENKTDEGASGTYNFDKAHSSIGFRVKHMGLVEVPGYFRDFTGTVNYDAKDASKSTVELTAKMTSVDTGVERRDNHLRNPDFFEVEKYPDMTFKSTKIEKKGKGWMLTGDLMMKGVTKQVTFPFNVVGFIKSERGTRMGATAETVVNRRDFGVNYDSKLPNGTPTVSDNITVVLNIEANMLAPQPAQPTKTN